MTEISLPILLLLGLAEYLVSTVVFSTIILFIADVIGIIKKRGIAHDSK